MEPKLVITMTSWTKRIHMAAVTILHFIEHQTDSYDKFYLFLSKTEFKSIKELPETLIRLSNEGKIEIVFLEKNYFSFKRMFVFPKHYNDIVISLDDDTLYPSDLIKTVKTYYRLYDKSIYNIFYNIGGNLDAINGEQLNFYYGVNNSNTPVMFSHSLMFFAQCVFMPQTFPLEIIDYIELKNKISPHDEETWFTYFIIKNNTYLSTLPYNYETDITEIDKNDINANWKRLSRKCINYNCNCRELQFYITLRYFNYVDKFIEQFPDYSCNKFTNCSLEELLKEYDKSYYLPL